MFYSGKSRIVSYPAWDDELRKYLTVENLLKVLDLYRGEVTSRRIVDFLEKEYGFVCTVDEVRELFLTDLVIKKKLIRFKSGSEYVYCVNPRRYPDTNPINSIVCFE